MNQNIKLAEFLHTSREVTNNYIKARGEWSKIDQWKKIREEEQEFRDAVVPKNELEEFWDCFFAKLTLLHLEKFQDDEIMESAIATWNKIYQRSWNVLDFKKQAQQTSVTSSSPKGSANDK